MIPSVVLGICVAGSYVLGYLSGAGFAIYNLNRLGPRDPFGDSSIWKCSQCGEILAQEISIATWRWNGSSWEHQCENVQAGYSKARYFQEVK